MYSRVGIKFRRIYRRVLCIHSNILCTSKRADGIPIAFGDKRVETFKV